MWKQFSVCAAIAATCAMTWFACSAPRNPSTSGGPDSAVAGPQQAYSDGTVIEPDDPYLRYAGHWDTSHLAEQAVTVNSGSRIWCRFTGRRISGRFGIQGITHPAQIYVSIDHTKPVLYTLNTPVVDFTPSPLHSGSHSLEMAVKDVDERADRWVPPLASAVVFKGFLIDAKSKTLPLPPPPSLKMEFYGDSITQGVRALNMAIGTAGSDGTADYAFLTALAFGALENQIGFGRQGIIRTGNGDVPPAAQSFGWNYEGSRADPAFIPEVVVVNQGTNDGTYSSAQFEPAYRAYIEEIRTAYPKAWIFCMRPFGGFHEKDIRRAVLSMRDRKIVYVDTTKWLSASDFTDGVHPTVAGHLKAAKKLIRVISVDTALKPVRDVSKPWWE